MKSCKNITHVAFDADDTLWVNETFFRDIENEFFSIMKPYGSEEYVRDSLFRTEMVNMDFYGYGVKPFILSVIETGLNLSDNKLSQKNIARIIEMGKALLNASVELLPDVVPVLEFFQKNDYPLILATKGDALDQERKLSSSGLQPYFQHVEVMSDKKLLNYKLLFSKLDISPEQFLMIGNSVKSDIIPVLDLGGSAIHIPFHTTWLHESVNSHEYTFPVYKDMADLLSNLLLGDFSDLKMKKAF